MASPRTPHQLRGLTFAPTDADLITLYLHPKVSGSPLPAATARYIHDADVYAADPAALVDGLLSASARKDGEEWYFFTAVQAKSSGDSRRSRAVAGGAGTWHSEKARHDVTNGDGVVVGYRQFFTYEPKNGWLMAEFSQQDPRRGEPLPVLCKIYQTRRAGRSASNPISSASSSMSGSKRKASAERSVQGYSARVRRCLPFHPAPAAPNPLTLVASSEIHQEPFLVPVQRPQAEQEPEETQELPVPREPTSTPPIPSFPMAADHALTLDHTAFLLPAGDWATPANSDLSYTSTALLGNYGFVSPATSDLSFYNATTPFSDNAGDWAFPPSTPISSYGTAFLPHCQDWLTPESSQASEASTLENQGYFSPDHATSRLSSNGAGFSSFHQYSELSAIFGR